MRFSEIAQMSGTKRRRLRVLKAKLMPTITPAIMSDIAAGAEPDLFERAAMRVKAKHVIVNTMMAVIPDYIEAGGDVNSFQYDILFLLDRHMEGSITTRAYWGRMATDAWRGYEKEHADG